MPKTKRSSDDVLADLEQVRASLQGCDPQGLRARQKALWAEGRALGLDSRALAERSGVSATNVRLYWNPEKAAGRAERRKGKPRKKAAK